MEKKKPDAAKQIREDLIEILQKQPFPIRGWHMTVNFAPGNPYSYPVHDLLPGSWTDEGIPEKAEALFFIAAHELVLTADFRMESCQQIGGRPWSCPELVKQQQWCRFANTNGSLEIVLDAKKVPPFQERLLYPNMQEWDDQAAHWSKTWKDSQKSDNRARWCLVQLGGIRDSANGMLAQSLGRLVLRVQKQVPDYWAMAEAAMAGRLTEEAIAALDKYPIGKGALTIRSFQRPKTPVSDGIQ